MSTARQTATTLLTVWAVTGGLAWAQPDSRHRGPGEQRSERRELREDLRGERQRPFEAMPPERGGDPRGRERSSLSPDERQELRRQLREQPPWPGQR